MLIPAIIPYHFYSHHPAFLGRLLLHSLDMGLRFVQPQWSLSLRFYLPLDDVLRDDDLLGGGADVALYF